MTAFGPVLRNVHTCGRYHTRLVHIIRKHLVVGKGKEQELFYL